MSLTIDGGAPVTHGDVRQQTIDRDGKVVWGPAFGFAQANDRLNPALVKRGDMLTPDDVLELLAVDLLGIVPEDETVVISSNRGSPVAMDSKSRAGEAFQNIARRLNGEKVPFMNLEQKDDLFSKIARFMRREERTGGN